MSAYAKIYVSGRSTLAGQLRLRDIPLLSNTGDVVVTQVDLSSGDNTLSVPTDGTRVLLILIPPTSNALAMTLKGAAPDTGIALLKTLPNPIPIGAGVTSIIVNAAGTITGCKLVYI